MSLYIKNIYLEAVNNESRKVVVVVGSNLISESLLATGPYLAKESISTSTAFPQCLLVQLG